MKLKLLKANCLPIALFLFILMTTGCKKDQLEVNEVKRYSQVDHVPGHAYDGGWSLTLQPDGVAVVVPSGDIMYNGTYKINGSKIKVKMPQNAGSYTDSYTFKIISKTEIKEEEFGTLLRLEQ